MESNKMLYHEQWPLLILAFGFKERPSVMLPFKSFEQDVGGTTASASREIPLPLSSTGWASPARTSSGTRARTPHAL